MVIHTRHGMIMVRSCHCHHEINHARHGKKHDQAMVTMVIIIT